MRPSTRRPVLVLLAFVMLMVLPISPARATGVESEDNPDLDATCGLDISLVIDRSGSIGDDKTKVEQAAQAFVDALIGTGSKVQVVSFSTTATAEPGSEPLLSDLEFRDPSTLDIPVFNSAGSTNWDDALEMVRRSPAGHAPLTVVITDGDPTKRNEDEPDGHGGGTEGTGSSTSQADLDAAVYEANALKQLDTHMFVVGVGSGLSNATSESRIQKISDTDKLTFSGGNPNMPFGQADYTLVTEFDALKTTVSKFVRELCGPSLNVVKKLQLTNGSTVDATDADIFSFDVSLAPAASSWQSPVQGAVATASLPTSDGVANFAWEPNTPDASTVVTLSEQAKAGWVYNGTKCWINNLDGTPAELVVDDVGANAPGASKPSTKVLPALGAYQAMNCEVYNRQIQPAVVTVDKVTAPTSWPDAFSFELKKDGNAVSTIPALTDAAPPAAFTAVAPGTYDVVEGPSAHFTNTAAVCDNLATQGVETATPTGLAVTEGSQWQCTFTNTVHNGTINIVKDLVGAPTGSFPFTSNIPANTAFSLSPTASTNATKSISVAPGTYTVAEGPHAPYALSSSCTGGNTPGAIVVGPDETVTCTFTNAAPAPTITVTKQTLTPTLAEPGGMASYGVTITNTSPEPLELTELSDVVNGDTIDVLTLPPDRTTCAPFAGSVIQPGATVACTFTAPVTGNAGQNVEDTVTAVAVDEDDNEATDDATASVQIVDVTPTITISKSTTTPVIDEPGASVVYDLAVTNTSNETVTVLSLIDQVGAGPLLPLNVVAGPLTSTTCALTPILPSATYLCSFTMVVTGDAGDVVTDTASVLAIDDDGSTVTASDTADVTVADVLPSITVTKDAAPTSRPEPGGSVTYTVGITNNTAEPVTITSISDVVGSGTPVLSPGTCAAKVNTTLAGNASTTCTFTMQVVGDASDGPVIDTVTVGAADDDQNTTTAFDTASVTITDVLPEISVTKSANPTSVTEPGGTVTYTVGITNGSVEPVTIDAIMDSVDGGPPVNVGLLSGTCAATLGSTLAVGASTSCTFDLPVAANGGDDVDDVVTVSAGDDDGNQASDSAEATVTVNDVLPDITVTKTAAPLSVAEPGGDVTYTVSVQNDSVEPLTLTTLSDVVGANPPIDVTTVAGTDCALPQVLAVSGSYTCSFTLAVSGNGGTGVTDVVTATATDDDGNSKTESDDAVVQVTDALPAIVITKDASPLSIAEPGGTVTYTVEITNLTAEAVTIDSIMDKVGDGVPFAVGGTCAAMVNTLLAGGATTSCTFEVAIVADASDGPVSDVVTVVAHDDDQNSVSSSDGAVVAVSDVAPAVSVEKTADPGTVPEPGADVTFTVTVTNDSVEPVTIDAMSDLVDSGPPVDLASLPGTCGDLLGVELDPDESETCTFVLRVEGDAGDVVGDVVTVTVSDDDDNSTTGTDEASVTVTDVLPDISVTKAAAPAEISEPGGTVTYTVEIENNTDEAVTIDSIMDSVDGGVPFAAPGTCAALLGTSLPAHGATSCTFDLALVADATDGSIGDVITVTVSDNDGNTDVASDDAVVEVLDVPPSITVGKSATPATVAEPGALVTYTVEVTNDSVEPVTIDALSDSVDGGPAIDLSTLPGTCDELLGTSLDPDETVSCTFDLLVEGNADDEVGDVVTVTVSDDDENQITDTASATVPVTDVLPAITVTKVAGAESVIEPGGDVTFTVTVENDSVEPVTLTSLADVVGTSPALDVTELADTTCDLPQEIAVDGSYQCTFTVPVEGLAGDSVTDVVTATVEDDDGNETTGDGTATVTVEAVADLAIDKSVTQAPVVGQTGTYTLAVTNNGPSAAHNLTVSDELPASLTATAAVGEGWTCVLSEEGKVVTCTRPTLAAGETASVILTVSVADPGTGASITNTATVTSPTPDPDLTNNTDTVTSLPVRVLGEIIAAPVVAAIPRTGSETRPWLILADIALICGVGLLMGEAGAMRNRRRQRTT